LHNRRGEDFWEIDLHNSYVISSDKENMTDVNIRLEHYDNKVTSSDKEISILDYSYPKVENTDETG
jgi:cell division septal protein FtsQ